MQITVVTESAESPVTLAEVKAWLKVDHNEDDAQLTELINSAVKTIESYINAPIILKTILFAVDNYYVDDDYQFCIYLPYNPIAISFVKIYDKENVANTITDYEQYSKKIVICSTIASRSNQGYEVQFTSGIAADAMTTPADIKTVIKEIVAFYYDDCCDKDLNKMLSTLGGYINFSQLAVYE